ncbi:heat stress transcription factor A-5, partial [Tanacetum coccineum]
GFIKIDPEKWEFANEEFLKDKNHLLKNIHRRKPVHSHSTPQTSTVDPERAAFEEEIDKLTREKASLEKNLLRYKQQQPASKLQLEDLTQRVNSMEQRQDALLTFLKKAARYPEFVEHLAQKLESIDFQPITRKEDGGSPQFRSSEGCTRTTEATPGRLLELSDTCTSLGFNMGSSLTHKTGPTLDTKEETEVHPSCQLNLTLASSVSQINPCQKNDTIPQSFDDIGKPPRENGFRKIDPEKWEFATKEFLKDKYHLLKNIHCRKPVHSHSTPQTSTIDPERAAFEEEIDKLTRKKTSLEKNLIRHKQQQPASKLQLEDLTQRVNYMEQRQDALLIFLKKSSSES